MVGADIGIAVEIGDDCLDVVFVFCGVVTAFFS